MLVKAKQCKLRVYKLIKLISYILLTFSDWLLTPGNKFSVTPIEETNKEELILNACLKSFYTSVRKQDGQFYKSSSREFPGSLPATKNHQGGLSHAEDESDGKIFAVPESAKCPVKTIKNHLSHLNPKLDSLFQRPREARRFKPGEGKAWCCNSPLGGNILVSMLKLQ